MLLFTLGKNVFQ